VGEGVQGEVGPILEGGSNLAPWERQPGPCKEIGGFFSFFFFFNFYIIYSLLRYKKSHGALAMAKTKPKT